MALLGISGLEIPDCGFREPHRINDVNDELFENLSK